MEVCGACHEFIETHALKLANSCERLADVRDAALGGHLEVLQWARAHGCPWVKRECEAVSRRHPEALDTLAWMQHQRE